MTIAGMVLVNNPGTWSTIYGPLKHAEWHGITPTDYIFPFFLFIVGISIVLSYGKALNKGESKELVHRFSFTGNTNPQTYPPAVEINPKIIR